MNLKTLRIQKDTHTRLKIFCANHGFKINEWVDVIINEKIDLLTNKKYANKVRK